MIQIEEGFFGKDRGVYAEKYDLEHPRILWNSVGRRSTTSASTEATGFEAVNAATPTTFDAWRPTALPADWTLTFDDAETISAVAIDTHTLGTSGASISIQKFDVTWIDIMPAFTPDK